MNTTSSAIFNKNRSFSFWGNLRLGRKLLVAFSALAVLALVVGVVGSFGLNSVKNSYEHALADGGALGTTSLTLSNNLLTARRHEKDFLLRWQDQGFDQAYTNYVIPNQQAVAEMRKNVDALSKFAPTVGESFATTYPQSQYEADLVTIKQSVDLYELNFQKAVQLSKERGFQDTGLEGQFRTDVRNIEALIIGRQDLNPLLITLLTIRRHEKDYLLRGEKTYIDQTHQAVIDLKQQIATSDVLNATEKKQITALADRYVASFDTLVAKDVEIAAAIQTFRDAAHTMEPLVAKLAQTGTDMSQADTATARTNSTQTLLYLSVTLLAALLAAIFLSILLSRQITNPVRKLNTVALELGTGKYDVQAEITSGDEIGTLAETFNGMARQLKQSVGVIAERAKALEVSTEVSRRLTSILNPQQLANEVVTQVQTAFNYYYAQIYLFDETGDNLVLNAGTGEAGQVMLKRGHSLPKGRGLVGRAAATKESILVPDTSRDPNWLPNEFLPDTKAEAVVPIIIGDKVLGVLDVQDNVTNDITPEDITLLESLASQVAISLQNADSYARAETALQEARSLVENAPEAIVIVDLTTGLFTDPNENAVKLYGLSREELAKVGPAQVSPPTQPDGHDSTEKAMEKIGEAMQGGKPVFEWMHRNAQGQDISCEIRLVRLPGDKPRVRASITDISERKSLQELTAQRARQQEAINTITQKIQAATTIEEAMQVAARELGNALGKRQTLVTLEPEALVSDYKSNG